MLKGFPLWKKFNVPGSIMTRKLFRQQIRWIIDDNLALNIHLILSGGLSV